MVKDYLVFMFLSVSAGAAMGLGFWGSKKLTNKCDEWLAMQDPEVRKLAEEVRKAAAEKRRATLDEIGKETK